VVFLLCKNLSPNANKYALGPFNLLPIENRTTNMRFEPQKLKLLCWECKIENELVVCIILVTEICFASREKKNAFGPFILLAIENMGHQHKIELQKTRASILVLRVKRVTVFREGPIHTMLIGCWKN